MNNATLTFSLISAAASVFVGVIFGLAYFRALRRIVGRFVDGRGWLGLAGLTLVRVAGAVVLLTAIAQLGAAPLLAAFLGFLLARMVALHLVRRTL